MAKRFKFRFETLLKIRRQREQEHQRIVAGRMQKINRVRQRINSIDDQIRSEEQAIRNAWQPGIIDLHQAMRHRHWLGRLHKGSLEAQNQLRYQEAELARERAELAEVCKHRKIIEKLKEKQWDRHRREEESAEAKEIDEMATVRHIFDRQEEMEVVHS
jgi:flagellar protein FliJ